MIYNNTVDIAEDSERFEPQQVNIRCSKGSTFLWFIRVKVPKIADGWNATDDIAGNAARMQWRTTPSAASTVIDAATGAGDYMEIDETDPENLLITIEIPPDVTDGLVFSTIGLGTSQSGNRAGDQGVYDIEVVRPDTRVFRILEGTVTLSEEVTR
jgi:hypothetical protein